MDKKTAESSENDLIVQKELLEVEQFTMPYKELANFSTLSYCLCFYLQLKTKGTLNFEQWSVNIPNSSQCAVKTLRYPRRTRKDATKSENLSVYLNRVNYLPLYFRFIMSKDIKICIDFCYYPSHILSSLFKAVTQKFGKGCWTKRQ